MRLWESKKGKNTSKNDKGSYEESKSESRNGELNNENDVVEDGRTTLSGVNALHERTHCIFREYDAVARNPIEGIYITVGADTPLIWYGLLIVRSGIFYGGMFRFSVSLPDDFPDTHSIPIVQFEEPLFHPLVHPKNNWVDLSRFFPSGWQRNRNHIYQVITATQGIFFSCQCDSSQAANPEAAILLKENRSKFIHLAHDAVRRSRTQVYASPSSEDQNAIRFTPWNEREMEPIRLSLLEKSDELTADNGNSQEKKLTRKGISWISNEGDNWT